MRGIKSIVLNNVTYKENTLIEEVDLAYVPWKNNSMEQSFDGCTNLTTVTNINNNVNYMYKAFANCPNLTTVSELPTGPLISIQDLFLNCTSLVNPPVIPISVTALISVFSGCTSLVNPPVISNNVIYLSWTYENCSSLTDAPSIPDSVTDMVSTFWNCQNLKNVSTISNNLSILFQTFVDCTSLVNIPEIPNSVTNMASAFRGCTNLTGDIIIHSENIINATYCFDSTSLNKDVYIPFQNNGVNTETYKAFTSAGYDEIRTNNGVRLIDINGSDIDLSDYNYDDDTYGNITLTKYKGSNIDIITPHL